jgi:hypothetical protein
LILRGAPFGVLLLITCATAAGGGVGWSNGYACRRTITIDHGKVPNSDQANFPVLLSGTYPYLATTINGGNVTSSKGYDVIFTSDAAGGSTLAFEQESYSASTGAVNYWVKVPTVSHTADTVIYMFYGNSSVTTDQSSKTATWDTDFKGVWHLSDQAGSTTVADSTTNGNNGTSQRNTTTVSTIGQIGNALNYDGTQDWTRTSLTNTFGDFTLEAWFKVAASGDNPAFARILDKRYDAGAWLGKESTNLWGGGVEEGGSPYGIYGSAAEGSWHHIVTVRSGATHTVYIDGAAVASNTISSSALSNDALYFGATNVQGNKFKGSIDEVRASQTARSSDWIAAEYNNQNSPGSFYSVGSPDNGGDGSTVSITVTSSPSGLALSVDGSPCIAPCSFNWTPGSNHTIAVASLPQSGGTGIQYLYSSWSDSGGQSHSITPSLSTTYTANFTTQYYLTTSAGTGGNISPASGWQNSGAPVSVSATTNSGYTFSGFSGSLTGSTNPQNVTMSAARSVTANFQSSGGAGTGFLTGYALNSPPLRSDFSGWVGMKLTVGSSSLTVSSLGRVCVAGNSGTHAIKFVTASDGIDVPGGSSSVNMSGCAAGQFSYEPLANPITLQANTAYYLATQEQAGGDQWYDYGNVTSTNSGTVNNSVYSFNGANWNQTNLPSTSYVPPNFLYTTGGSGSTIQVTVQTAPAGSSFSVDGTTYTTAQTFSWTPSSSHTIASRSAQSGAAGTQYVWTGWSDGGALSHTITPANAISYTASFTTQFLLSTSVTPASGGSISTSPSSGSGYFDNGTAVQLTASAGGGYTFSGFSGDLTGSTNPQIVMMNSAKSVTANFNSSGDGGGWSNGYSYRRTITIDHTKVPNTDQTNFPVLISPTLIDLKTSANGGSITNVNGYDIIFTSDPAGSSMLAFEQDSYSASTGAVNYWVKVSTVSHTTDTVIYLFYGNSSVTTDQSNKTATWDTDFKGVWHLDDNAASTVVAESTSNANTGTNWRNTSAVTIAGQIGKGLSYDGSQDWTSTLLNTAFGNFTLEAWFTVVASGNNAGSARILDKRYDTGAWVGKDTAGGANSWGGGVKQAGSPYGDYGLATDGSWHHIVSVRSGTTHTVYIDGAVAAVNNNVSSSALSNDALYFGANTATGNKFKGSIDEVRASQIARSSDWIAAEYNNQRSPGSFFTVGNADMGGSGGSAVPITVTSSPTGLALSVDNSSCTAPCSFNWTPGSSHTIAVANSPQAGASGTQYVYGGWSDSGGQSHSITTTSSATIYAANFTTQYYLTTSAGTGGIISPSSNWQNSGAAVSVNATANGGYTFSGFTGDLTGTATPQSLTMNAPKSVTASFNISSGGGWSNGYSYRRAITIDHTKVPNTDQTNFPVLVSGTYSYLATTGNVTNSNGYDVIFTSDAAGSNPLAFEQESYSASTGEVNYWIKVPTLSHTADTVIYMFYGNPLVTTSQSNKTAVWDSNYAGVYHFPNGSTLNANDSTSNGNTGSVAGASPATGQIGGGGSFNGSGSYIDAGNTTGLQITSNAITLSAWIKPTNAKAASSERLIVKELPSNGNPYVAYVLYRTQAGNTVRMGVSTSGSFTDTFGGTLSAGSWAHVVGTYDGSYLTLYVNGSPVNSTPKSGNITSSTKDVIFGADTELGDEYFNGTMDEVRISNTARSADWIAAEYNNQNSPGSFYSVGSERAQTSSGPETTTTTLTTTAPDPVPPGLSVVLSAQVSGTASGTVTFKDGATVLGTGTLSDGTATFTAAGLVSGIHNFTAEYAGDALNFPSVSTAITRTVIAPSSGWSNGYTFRGAITVHSAQVPNTDQANFPVLVSGTYADLANTGNGGQVINPDGYDIIFTSDASGLNRLNYERAAYSGIDGQVAFWVQIPMVYHLVDTVFYVFYGNPAITVDQSNKTEVWDSSYAGVWHLDDNAASNIVADSTVNANNGAAAASTTVMSAPGILGKGLRFNGSTDLVNTSVSSGETFTWEAWVNSGTISNANYQSIITLPGAPYMLMDVGYGGGSFWPADGANTNLGVTGLTNTTWYHLAFVRSGDNSAFGYSAYLNGVARGQQPSGTWSNPSQLTFGSRVDSSGQNFSGTLDEIRVSNIARSADWIAAEYHNQSSPQTFYSVSWNQLQSDVTPPPIFSVSPLTVSLSGVVGSGYRPSQALIITSSNTTVLGNWSATVDGGAASWIKLSTAPAGTGAAIVNGSGPTTLYVQAMADTLDIGMYQGTVSVSSADANGSPQSVTVQLNLTAPPSLISAARFLHQTSWGATPATLAHLMNVGFSAYLDEQMAALSGGYPENLKKLPTIQLLQQRFFQNAMFGDDQLRQRVAFALSQILVASNAKPVADDSSYMTTYQRILLDGAFGNFYDLLRNVTLSAEMGWYLDMVNNPKANPSLGTLPNENYAREVMQVFTLGTSQLGADGSPLLDSSGNSIPTYGQSDIRELARVFTGWTFGDNIPGPPSDLSFMPFDAPMEPVESYHDTGSKTVLGQTIAANQSATQDLDEALQIIFQHPNVGPFISRLLIQHLVTSNPSHAYLQRVAAVFADDGYGVRGDLQAVVKAIVLDPEASLGQPASGHLREPALFITSALRGLNVSSVANFETLVDAAQDMGQWLFFSPSVFNYYSPDFRTDKGILGPEFQLLTTAIALIRANWLAILTNGDYINNITYDLTPYATDAADPSALVDRINNTLMGGLMSSDMRQSILTAVSQLSDNTERARTALYLALVSFQYQVEN